MIQMATSYISYEAKRVPNKEHNVREVLMEVLEDFREKHGDIPITRANCSFNEDSGSYEITIRAKD